MKTAEQTLPTIANSSSYMQAMCYDKYKGIEALELRKVAEPQPKSHEVLIRVHATSINSWDWDLLRGSPFIVRMEGLFKPRHKVLGADVAGRVEAVGSQVKSFSPGDEVYGDLSSYHWGGFGEYVCADASLLALKSKAMSFEEAAAIPQAGVLALQGLRDFGEIKAGQQVLINGASGGVGTFAVQLARYYGAEVIAVDKGAKLNLARRLGADMVMDGEHLDYCRIGKPYDLILDPVANKHMRAYAAALKAKGIFVLVGGASNTILQAFSLGQWISWQGSKKIRLLMHKPKAQDLEYLNVLYEAGVVKPVIDRLYPLHQLREAFRYYVSGRVMGKIVIRMQ